MNQRILGAMVVGCLWTMGCSAPPEARNPEVRTPVIGFSFIRPEMQACADKALRGHPEPSDLPMAFARFKDGCELGDPAACSLLGVMYERGLAVPRSETRARTLFARSCTAGNKIGCANLLEAAGLAPLPTLLAPPVTALR